MEAKEPKKLRRRFWIDSEIQARFVVFCVGGCAVLSALMVCVIFGLVWSQMGQYISISGDVNPQQVFRSVFTWAVVAAGIVFVVSAAAGSLLMIFVTHRIAGPVYRIQKLLDSRAVPEPDRLRSGDALKEVYAKIYALHSRNAELSQRYDEIIDTAGKLCVELMSGDRPLDAASGTLDELRKLVAKAEENPQA